VSAVLLRAIAWHEGGFKTHWVSKNANGSRDIGALQINSIHLKELAQYGVHEADLLDGCVSAYVGAWHLKRQIDKYGLTWQAVGAYHSASPDHNAKYANIIIGVLASWGAIDVRDARWQATRSALATQAQSVAQSKRRGQADTGRRGVDMPASPVIFDRSEESTHAGADPNE
jgi:soluble lytic murein transglycosylase-like protein